MPPDNDGLCVEEDPIDRGPRPSGKRRIERDLVLRSDISSVPALPLGPDRLCRFSSKAEPRRLRPDRGRVAVVKCIPHLHERTPLGIHVVQECRELRNRLLRRSSL